MKLLSVLALGLFTTPLFSMDLDFYIGTYTKPGGSQGIYHAKLNDETGAITLGGLVAELKNPTFLALHPNGKQLYAAVEMAEGGVAGFAIEKDGKLRPLGTQVTKGRGNCHVWVDASGKNLLAANYGNGSIACVPIKPDGTFGEPSAAVQHKGSGPNPGRQKEPHAHSIYDHGGFVYACDLGTDDVFIYKFDADKGTLEPNNPPSGKVPPGGGPRHLAFHPKGGFAYVCNEMTSGITAFAHDAAKGTLTPIQTLSTLPEGYADAAKNSTAEIFCHPNGKFVYVSNRGHDSFAVFAIGADGKLTPVEYAPAHAKAPRGFNFSPDGKWIVAGGQNSDNLAVHKVDPATGKLTFVSELKGVGAPVSIQFVKK
jgi:6-phosphogluconolactonase